jgi:hypothetical protein
VLLASYDGTHWTIEPVLELAAGRTVRYVSLAIDGLGWPHIACGDFLNSDDAPIRYASRDGAGWTHQVVESGGSFSEYGLNIVVDSQHRPHLVYRHHRSGYTSRYAWFNGVSWVKESWGSEGYFPSIALDGSDRPHVAYIGNGRLGYALRNEIGYAEDNGTSLIAQTVDAAVGDSLAGQLGLALGNRGTPWLAYAKGNTGTLVVAVNVGIAWTSRTATSSGASPSLAGDGQGRIYLAFVDTTARAPRVQSSDGTEWFLGQPAIRSRETMDRDGNGHLDGIRLSANCQLNDDFAGVTVVVSGRVGVEVETGDAGDDVFFVRFAEGVAPDTGELPAVQLLANSSLSGRGRRELIAPDPAPVLPVDAVPPRILGIQWIDAVGVRIAVSEPFHRLLRRTGLGAGIWQEVPGAGGGTQGLDPNPPASSCFYQVDKPL